MENNQNEIKEANHKAMPKFIIILIFSMILGGIFGFCSVKYGLYSLAGKLKVGGAFFGMNIAPWILLVLAIAMPIICIPFYSKAKKMLKHWDGEDELLSDQVEQKLSFIVWISNSVLILSYFLIAASYSGGFKIFDIKKNVILLFVGIGAFMAVMIEAVLFQQRCIDMAKQINPEKKASVYDVHFQKKWLNSCDEAERLLIGKCAYKAYSATNISCTVFAVLLALAALVFDTGFLPSLVVCAIWIVNQSIYCKEAIKLSKFGSKIS